MSYLSENFTFSKSLPPHFLSRSEDMMSHKRRHHGDAWWCIIVLQRIHHIYGR